MNDTSFERAAASRRLLANAERRGAQLVRGADVDAIDLAMRRDRREVDHARREHHRQLGLRHRGGEPSRTPPMPPLLAGRREIGEPSARSSAAATVVSGSP